MIGDYYRYTHQSNGAGTQKFLGRDQGVVGDVCEDVLDDDNDECYVHRKRQVSENKECDMRVRVHPPQPPTPLV